MTDAKPDPIRIAFCAEGRYIPHAATMLNSLLATNRDERLELFMLEGPDSDLRERLRLKQWLLQKGVSVSTVPVPDDEVLGETLWSPWFPRSVWYRVLLPKLLPRVQKVLYLDADTLVLHRIRLLWETDLSGNLFAAVVNPLYPFMPNWPVEHLGVPTRGHYLNSGVLLLDLERMRQEDCIGRVRAFLASSRSRNGHVAHDQDALAALYHDRCLFLHPRWNMQTTFFELGLADIPARPEDIVEARRNPAIVHFIGAKPSHYLCRHPYRDAYLHHRRSTPWPLAAAEGRSLANFVLRTLPPMWLWRAVAFRNKLLTLLRSERPR